MLRFLLPLVCLLALPVSNGSSEGDNKIPGVKHIGCFVDTKDRDLPTLAMGGKTDLTVLSCYTECKKLGSFKFIGLQAGDHCFCGNTYGRYGKKVQTECATRCSGDRETTCGDHWRNDIYSTGVEIEAYLPGVKHIGCFVDTKDRDLPTLAMSLKTDLTVLSCYAECKKLGSFKFMGLQAGMYCFCGNTYGRYGKKEQTECKMRCSGDMATTCGNDWRNDIYSTGVEIEASLTDATTTAASATEAQGTAAPEDWQ